MERLYLLRNNQESGPFTLKELRSMGVFAGDLVWIEGESTSWNYPADVDSLRGCIRKPEKKQPAPKKKAAFPNERADALSIANTAGSSASDAVAANDSECYASLPYADITPPSFEELKQKHANRPRPKKVWKRQVNVASNLFGLVVLLLGVTMAAVMVKKAVDNMEFEPLVATADAREIAPEQLPVSTASHAAMASPASPILPLTATGEPVAEAGIKTATVQPVEEEKPLPANLDEQQLAEAVKASLDSQEEATKVLLVKNDQSNGGQAGKADGQPDEEKKEKPAAKPALVVAANEYSVGMLGGISNLELTIKNPSSTNVDKALVEVEYLKPNGKVVDTKKVEVSDLAAGGSKKITVPNSSRGVSVRYRVANL